MKYLQQLQAIKHATGWSQERLAAELGVSFPALNAWLNNRAVPRAKAQARIHELYLNCIGMSDVSAEDLWTAKQAAYQCLFDVSRLIADKSLLDKLTLHLTYHTNVIEGSTMTLADVNDVIFDNKVLANRTAIEQLEAKNHQAALHWLIEQVANGRGGFSITKELIMGIHLRLMNGITSDAGQYRRHAVRIMGAHVPLANWQSVSAQIAQLTGDDNLLPMDPIARLAAFHATFEKIHPFSDGNGRTGRLVMMAQALSIGLAPPIVLKERKQAYYKYLETAQLGGSCLLLEQFIAESIQFTGKLLVST